MYLRSLLHVVVSELATLRFQEPMLSLHVSRMTPVSVMVGDMGRQHDYLQACQSILGKLCFKVGEFAS